MAHPRTTIKAAIAERLADLETTGSNVFLNRFHLLDTDSIPALIIRTGVEDSRRVGKDTKQLLRGLEIEIEIKDQDNSENIETVLDDICVEIEAAMNIDETFGGSIMDSWLSGTAEAEYSGEGAKVVGSVKLTYSIIYEA